MKILAVIDMQKDFISGALGTSEAERIVSRVAQKIAAARAEGVRVVFTRDTHTDAYLDTQEGRKLPVPHCIQGSQGWQIRPELEALRRTQAVDKPGFGSVKLAQLLREMNESEPIGSVTLIGLCTDICVISNAMLIKAYLPELPVKVDAACCAGVTPESHENALAAMAMCQIEILR